MAVVTALVAAAPLPAATVSHPESTRMDRPAEEVAQVRIRVLDKVEARQVVMTLPLGIAIPLPDAVHSLKVTGYTRDFALDRMPPGPDTDPDEPEAAKPVPREDGQGNAAVRLRILREGEAVAESWVFARAPYLFQPPNMRYTFALLGAKGPGERTPRP